MKSVVCAKMALTILLLLALVGAAGAASVRWDSDGTKSLTQDGWSLAGVPSSQLMEMSFGESDPGTNGVWRIVDLWTDAHMRMYRDPGGILPDRGLVMARVKYYSSTSFPKGTFGYSSVSGNHSALVAIRNGALNFKTAEDQSSTVNDGGNVTVPGGTAGYRVYALAYTTGGTFNVWVSNGDNWSPNEGEWTQLVTNGGWQAQSAMLDQTGNPCTGLLMGSFGPRAELWNGSVDYIAWSNNSNEQVPWDFQPVAMQPNDAQYVSDTIPASMTPGQTANVSVTFRNAGTNSWTAAAGYKLGAVDDSDPFCALGRSNLAAGDTIATNQDKTFTIAMTAPTTAGVYTTDWRMMQEGVSWFGATLTKQITVGAVTSFGAQYISDTIPATMTAGQTYNISITMKNTGSTTWTSAGQTKLGCYGDSDPFYGPDPRVYLSPSDNIATDQTKAFSFTMTAPVAGTYTTDWQMIDEDNGGWFGPVVTKTVQVQAATGGSNVALDDPLNGSTTGTRSGGTFADGGWKITSNRDYIFWHLPNAISHGAMEFYVKGLIPRDPPQVGHSDNNLLEMYDYTYDNADYNYNGFRNNPYKVRVNKNGPDYDYRGTADAFQITWLFPAGNPEVEWETAVVSWNAATNYKIRIEWTPQANGTTICKMLRDDVLLWQETLNGTYTPSGHAVRLAWSTRPDDYSPINAVFSNLKVYDLATATVPQTPSVVWPVSGATVHRNPIRIHWSGDAHTSYQVRVNTSNDPNTGIVYDSGQVTSTLSQAATGTLPNATDYYAFVKIGNIYGWSGWTAGRAFRMDVAHVWPQRGNVRLVGYRAEDDGGPFLGLGFSYMSALKRCKYDRDRFRDDLAFMASNNFKYMRALSMVGWYTAWAGKEIAPISFNNQAGTPIAAWPDYWSQLTDMIDIAYDDYGIRTELTIFADAQLMPNKTDRINHMQTILNNIATRQHKIMHLEVCNEAWQNGFPGTQGEADLREFAAYLAARTTIPVAITSNHSSLSDMENLYNGSAADLCTYHLERDIGTSEGGWLPVRDSWKCYPSTLPPTSSNEPIGPGSSVASENDPIKLVSAACFAFIAKLPMYVYHTEAGVFGITRFQDEAAVSDYRFLEGILPSGLPGWTRNDGKESAAPFTTYCKRPSDSGNGLANTYWTDVTGATAGCHRNIGGIDGTGANGDSFVCYPQGILPGGVTLQCRRQVTFTVYNPLTGAVTMGPVTKNTNEVFTLSQGPGAYIIEGTLGIGDITAPGPVANFTATPAGGINNLSWSNPTDSDYGGTMIRYRTDVYPSSISDGSLVCNRTALPGSNDVYAHTGVQVGVTYYYAAFAYDEVPNYSIAALTSSVPVALPNWINETFDGYTDGNLGGQGGWATVGAAAAQVESSVAKGGAGKGALMDTLPTGYAIANQISFADKTTGNILVSFDVAQDATGTTGQAIGYVSVYGTTSSTEIVKVHVQKGRLFAEYGPGSLATLSTTAANLTWYNVKINLNVDTRKMDIWLDGVSKATNYDWKGTATNISKVVISSDRNTNLNPQKMYVDNLRVEPKPGQPAAVTDDGTWSPSLSKLHFAFDSVAGTPSYQYAIGTTSGGTQTRGWTNCGTSTDVTASGLNLTENTTNYYVSVQCLTEYGTPGTARNSNGIKVAPGLAKINNAKALPDGTATATKSLRGKLVSAVFPGYFYIQEPGQPFGLKVVSAASVAPGDLVDVAGYMQGSAMERYLECTGNGVIKSSGPGGPYPMVLRTDSLGGVDLNANTHGIAGGIGPHSVGLYVTVCGEVTQRQTTAPMYFYVDDGSGVKDGTTTGGVENVGVRVSGDPAGYPAGSYVSVRGVVSCFSSSGLRPQILPVNTTVLQAP